MVVVLTRFVRKFIARCNFTATVSVSTAPKLCVVGSGPAGFYCTQGLLRALPGCHVDIYEKLPVPFGLIRYGVAPDHPDVKNVINTFTTIAHNKDVSFYGNVTVGKDVVISELLAAYHAVILCTGADENKSLGIPGESVENVLSAKDVVGWYNGFPENAKLSINLDTDTAVILGQGNVALDIGRILLTSVDDLKKTDITERALQMLSRSRIKRVFLVGRRGPLQVAFTIKELRELMKLKGCKGIIQQDNLSTINQDIIKALPRPRQRITELIVNYSMEQHVSSTDRQWELIFYRRPLEFMFPTTSEYKNKLTGVHLAMSELKVDTDKAVSTSTKSEVLECGLAIKSIGYRSQPLEESIAFNHARGVIDNENGRVKGKKGLYCCGWVASGPIGVILTTVDDSFQLSHTVAQDIISGNLITDESKEGSVDILKHLCAKGVQVVTFKDWEMIDAEEQKRGIRAEKPREKIVDIKEMLEIAGRN